MINKVYVPQSLGVFVLCSAAAITLWPLGQLNQEIGVSISRLEHRAAFVNAYRQKQKEAIHERFGVGNMDESQVLSKLQETAQRAGMHLEHVDVQPPQTNRDHGYQAVAFDLVVSGSEAGLINFLEGIKISGFLCRLNSLEVLAKARQQGLIRARMRVEKIDHAGIQFVFRKKDAYAATFAPKRRLFKETASNTVKNVGSSQKARPDRIKDLSLVGIVDDNGRKAVIEDKQSQKTVFLTEGDCLEGFCIVEIGSGEVTLEHEGVTSNLVL